MWIGVVSDTHGHVEFTRAAVRMLESVGVGVVIHCGDVGSADVVRLFSPWPTHFVFGNVDDNLGLLRREMTAAGHTCHERFGALEWAGRRIAFLHGDDARRLRKAATSGQWDLVCYGHTHVARLEREGDTLLLNPGAVYRANPRSIAVVQLPSLEVTTIPLD
jgi:hypothetical protein